MSSKLAKYDDKYTLGISTEGSSREATFTKSIGAYFYPDGEFDEDKFVTDVRELLAKATKRE